jgi:Rap1a immunity proteins
MRFRTMRAIGILVVMLTLLFLGGQAKADNLGELKEECEELENFWRLYPPTEGRMKIPSRVGAAICFGYMEAIVGLTESIGIPTAIDPNCAVTPEGKVVGGPLCGHTLGICFPKGSSTVQVLAVFLAHARSHPAQWHEGAATHFQLAMMTAFPCKDEYPAPRTDEPARAFPLPEHKP